MQLRTIHLAGVALFAAATLAAGGASATVYDFTANLTFGPNLGAMTGTVDLPFVSGQGSGTGAASTVTLTGLPAGLTLDDGLVATDWAQQVINIFTVTNGSITAFQFNAVVAHPGTSDLCLNTGATFFGGGFTCPHNLIFIGDGLDRFRGGGGFGYNILGANGITFTAEAETGTEGVPEPATWGLMIGGFGMAGAAMRRRKAAA